MSRKQQVIKKAKALIDAGFESEVKDILKQAGANMPEDQADVVKFLESMEEGKGVFKNLDTSFDELAADKGVDFSNSDTEKTEEAEATGSSDGAEGEEAGAEVEEAPSAAEGGNGEAPSAGAPAPELGRRRVEEPKPASDKDADVSETSQATGQQTAPTFGTYASKVMNSHSIFTAPGLAFAEVDRWIVEKSGGANMEGLDLSPAQRAYFKTFRGVGRGAVKTAAMVSAPFAVVSDVSKLIQGTVGKGLSKMLGQTFLSSPLGKGLTRAGRVVADVVAVTATVGAVAGLVASGPAGLAVLKGGMLLRGGIGLAKQAAHYWQNGGIAKNWEEILSTGLGFAGGGALIGNSGAENGMVGLYAQASESVLDLASNAPYAGPTLGFIGDGVANAVEGTFDYLGLTENDQEIDRASDLTQGANGTAESAEGETTDGQTGDTTEVDVDDDINFLEQAGAAVAGVFSSAAEAQGDEASVDAEAETAANLADIDAVTQALQSLSSGDANVQMVGDDQTFALVQQADGPEMAVEYDQGVQKVWINTNPTDEMFGNGFDYYVEIDADGTIQTIENLNDGNALNQDGWSDAGLRQEGNTIRGMVELANGSLADNADFEETTPEARQAVLNRLQIDASTAITDELVVNGVTPSSATLEAAGMPANTPTLGADTDLTSTDTLDVTTAATPEEIATADQQVTDATAAREAAERNLAAATATVDSFGPSTPAISDDVQLTDGQAELNAALADQAAARTALDAAQAAENDALAARATMGDATASSAETAQTVGTDTTAATGADATATATVDTGLQTIDADSDAADALRAQFDQEGDLDLDKVRFDAETGEYIILDEQGEPAARLIRVSEVPEGGLRAYLDNQGGLDQDSFVVASLPGDTTPFSAATAAAQAGFLEAANDPNNNDIFYYTDHTSDDYTSTGERAADCYQNNGLIIYDLSGDWDCGSDQEAPVVVREASAYVDNPTTPPEEEVVDEYVERETVLESRAVNLDDDCPDNGCAPDVSGPAYLIPGDGPFGLNDGWAAQEVVIEEPEFTIDNGQEEDYTNISRDGVEVGQLDSYIPESGNPVVLNENMTFDQMYDAIAYGGTYETPQVLLADGAADAINDYYDEHDSSRQGADEIERETARMRMDVISLEDGETVLERDTDQLRVYQNADGTQTIAVITDDNGQQIAVAIYGEFDMDRSDRVIAEDVKSRLAMVSTEKTFVVSDEVLEKGLFEDGRVYTESELTREQMAALRNPTGGVNVDTGVTFPDDGKPRFVDGQPVGNPDSISLQRLIPPGADGSFGTAYYAQDISDIGSGDPVQDAADLERFASLINSGNLEQAVQDLINGDANEANWVARTSILFFISQLGDPDFAEYAVENGLVVIAPDGTPLIREDAFCSPQWVDATQEYGAQTLAEVMNRHDPLTPGEEAFFTGAAILQHFLTFKGIVGGTETVTSTTALDAPTNPWIVGGGTATAETITTVQTIQNGLTATEAGIATLGAAGVIGVGSTIAGDHTDGALNINGEGELTGERGHDGVDRTDEREETRGPVSLVDQWEEDEVDFKGIY